MVSEASRIRGTTILRLRATERQQAALFVHGRRLLSVKLRSFEPITDETVIKELEETGKKQYLADRLEATLESTSATRIKAKDHSALSRPATMHVRSVEI